MTMKHAGFQRARVAPRGVYLFYALIALPASFLSVIAAPAMGQTSWNPFEEAGPPASGPRRPGRAAAQAPISPGVPPPPAYDGGRSLSRDATTGGLGQREAVERSDLPPLAPADAGGERQPTAAAPLQRSGAATAALVAALGEIELPTRSPVLARLLGRIAGPRAEDADASVEGVGARATALYRAGRIREALAVAGSIDPAQLEAGVARSALLAFQARLSLALGDVAQACSGARSILQTGRGVPRQILAEAIGINGYCGIAAGKPEAAGLAAALGREQGGLPASTLSVLDAVASGLPAGLDKFPKVSVLDWRLAEASGKLGEDTDLPMENVEPAALVAIAESASAPGQLRVAAAEAAIRIDAIGPDVLAEAYRRQSFAAEDLAAPFSARGAAWSRRALLYNSARGERTPLRRARVVRAALDDARRAGIYLPMAQVLAPLVADIPPVAEVGWFAETAIEVMVAAGRYEDARRWARLGMDAAVTADRRGASLAHWQALIDIAGPDMRTGRGEALATVEELALRGRFTTEALHKLATVLDALDYAVPVRLWEAASRAPQPTTGHLPATGVLRELQLAARGKDRVRTTALLFRTLGREGPEAAQMITLGDAIRALKRAGLEVEARQVAFEALFGIWPRASSS